MYDMTREFSQLKDESSKEMNKLQQLMAMKTSKDDLSEKEAMILEKIAELFN